MAAVLLIALLPTAALADDVMELHVDENGDIPRNDEYYITHYLRHDGEEYIAFSMLDGKFALTGYALAEELNDLDVYLYITGTAEMTAGVVNATTVCLTTISGGTFNGVVYNYGTITGGTFRGEVENVDGGVSYFTIIKTQTKGGGTIRINMIGDDTKYPLPGETVNVAWNGQYGGPIGLYLLKKGDPLPTDNYTIGSDFRQFTLPGYTGYDFDAPDYDATVYAVFEDAPKLDAPTNLAWGADGVASWGAAEGAQAYEFRLYKDGTADANLCYSSDRPLTGTSMHVQSVIAQKGAGAYYFKARAVGDELNHSDSDWSAPSAAYIPLILADSANYDVPSGYIGKAIAPINVSLAVMSGVTPYQFALAEGAPGWLSIDAQTGVLTGKRPDSASSATTATIRVTDSAASPSTAELTIAVGDVQLFEFVFSVTDIENLPATATAGVGLTLSGTVKPNFVSEPITWEIVDAGGTGATVSNDGVFHATATGTATVTATVANGAAIGTAYAKDFAITVTDTQPTTYQVTIAEGTGMGAGRYEAGDTVTAIANAPRPGKRFQKWTGADGLTFAEGSATTAAIKFIMPANDVEITPVYEDIVYTLTVENGTGGGTYRPGAQVELIADPAPDGQQFAEWAIVSGGSAFYDATKPTTTYTVPENDATIQATYEPIPTKTYTLTVENGRGGGEYAEGRAVTVTAEQAEPGWTFKEWVINAGGGTLADPTLPITTYAMPAKASRIEATYEKTLYAVTVADGEGDGDYTVGDTVRISAYTAADGMRFSKWVVDSGNVALTDESATTTTFTMPAARVEVTATYEIIEIPVEWIDMITNAEIEVGKSRSLSATPLPAGTTQTGIVWSSDAETVAMVDQNGLVKAENEGTATIRATSAANRTVVAECIVTVTQAASAPPADDPNVDKLTVGKGKAVTRLSLKAPTTVIAPGEDVQIAATISPKKATHREVFWASADPAIAAVRAQGAVTGLAPGTTTITATATSGVSKSIKITVSDTITKFALNKTKLTLKRGKTYSLDVATWLPATLGRPTNLVWTSSKGSVATVDPTGLVTALKKGKTTITATDPVSGIKAKCKITVK